VASTMIPLIEGSLYKKFFDFLNTFIRGFKKKFTAEIIKMVLENLIGRLVREVGELKKYSEGDSKFKQKKRMVDKIWNILKFTANDEYLVTEFIGPIETSLSSVVQLLSSSDSQDFDEDIHECI
jgi:hypothetical protein